MNGQNTNIYDPTQLEIKDIVKDSIFLHYGWSKKNNEWIKGNGRAIPKVLDALNIRREDFYIRKSIGGDGAEAGERSHTFFDKGGDSKDIYSSNYLNANLPTDKFYIIYGISLKVATAKAATASISTMRFEAATDPKIVNGFISWRVNQDSELNKMPVKTAFGNTDGIKNYFRLPKPVVLEPNEAQELTLNLSKSFGANEYKFADFTLHGIILERK